ncbi:MAG: segregation/condensation protein A [Ignavibacteriales bacterium]|jgi:segregation and condensation protein A|nr:segregation/condensation protein A [Ignavibacteriaceae bacterium]NLH60613.1 segregation/condensation protein A [Ignavibacteriales bacterium]HOJ17408.1 segregation/condensation protein A [Ignavibacteriaceae bacterium]HPO56386.1 segregation/condensation protein A [Ignavibacteriaceae bacterium]
MFKIRLDQFEGPLDLLLFFIKRDELNIYDIPISRITKEYMEYVNYIKMLDLETAGDFIFMASTLMYIKVKMLLPKEVDEKGELIDPRADLVKALLEYKRYKEMAEELSFFESSERKISYRGNYEEDPKEAPEEFDILLKNVSVYDLAKAFKRVIESRKSEPVHQVVKIPVTIDEQITFIAEKINLYGEIHFLSLIDEIREKIRVIVTFIALLEMIKMQKIGVRTSENLNDFVLYKKTE